MFIFFLIKSMINRISDIVYLRLVFFVCLFSFAIKENDDSYGFVEKNRRKNKKNSNV